MCKRVELFSRPNVACVACGMKFAWSCHIILLLEHSNERSGMGMRLAEGGQWYGNETSRGRSVVWEWD